MILRALALSLVLALPAAAQGPFFLDITARFDLTDQTGARRQAADFSGRPMVIFFGYANCASICSVALPALADTLDLLGRDADRIAPILITIDPQADTPQALAEALPRWHPALIGLTGSEAALADARAAFGVEVEKLFETPDGQPVYAHGSYIYVVGADGKVTSLLPPILGAERMAEIIRAALPPTP